MPSEAEIPVARYLDRFTPEVKKILQAARRLVRSVGPGHGDRLPRLARRIERALDRGRCSEAVAGDTAQSR